MNGTFANEQSCNKVFMVRPVNFNYNEQTAQNNLFQIKGYEKDAQKKALTEFDNYVQLLNNNSVKTIVVNDTDNPVTPDSIFPNNWFSTHSDGSLVLYPMFAQNRRNERKEHFISTIKENFKTNRIIDLTNWEKYNKFLEGTGSMVLDRVNKIVYACRSPRTNEEVLRDFCNSLDYKPIMFNAVDKNNNQIYHTNVLMCVCTNFVIICLESVTNKEERDVIKHSILNSGRKIIDITFKQMDNFAGNMLEIKDKDLNKLLIMSDTAFNCLTDDQLENIRKECKIIHPDLKYIENNGGGSARCMLAEIFN